MRRQLLRSTAETAIRGVRGGRVPGDRSDDNVVKSQPHTPSGSIHCTVARSLMDRASDYGSEGWKFESSRARHA